MRAMRMIIRILKIWNFLQLGSSPFSECVLLTGERLSDSNEIGHPVLRILGFLAIGFFPVFWMYFASCRKIEIMKM